MVFKNCIDNIYVVYTSKDTLDKELKAFIGSQFHAYVINGSSSIYCVFVLLTQIYILHH